MTRYLGLAVLLASVAVPATAQTMLTVDATAPVPAPKTGYLKLGRATAPDGETLGINSRYLTLDGKPWLPVMGEVHFVRLPAAEWDEELAKIKASGVDIVATYMFWNYHEETPGAFDWTGDRDVRRFLELAGKHGLKVILRLGPWSHGEVRYGGVPDWVVRSMPTRGSDATYLHYVDRYWGEIGAQVKGLLWKDGGPVIGVQLENEYNLTGPGQGRQHIADLKALALKHGFDVPFYTVTGWDNAVYPAREALPVFGGYPDEPWGVTTTKLPPKETYAFRFDSRVSGNLGAQTVAAGTGDADPDIPNTPFLGAEYAGGLPTMYRRRPVVDPDDIAAMLPIQLGSGVNLYGYYMYHGGRNLIGRTTLQEATAIGGYNDLPIIDYGFQAPFGEYGETGAVLSHIRPFHLFLQSYGAQLAPMTVRKPDVTPRALDDLTTPRFSVRASGDSAFVFVSDHIRQYRMAPQTGVQFKVELPGKTVTFPSQPINIASGAYFVWPVGLDLGGLTLNWASAQPVTRLDGASGPLHVFAAEDGIAPEFAFPPGTSVSGALASVRTIGGQVVARVARPGTGALLVAKRPGSPAVRLLVLSKAQSRQLSRVRFAGADHLILSDATPISDGEALAFTSLGDPAFAISAFPALPGARGNIPLSAGKPDGAFTRYSARAPSHRLAATVEQLRAPQAVGPVPIGGVSHTAVEPWPESFGKAGAWSITVPADALDGLDDAYLDIDWAGDVGRLFANETLIDDRYFDGTHWRVGLRRNAATLGKPLRLTILPLRDDAPIYVDERYRPKNSKGGQIAELRSVTIEPQYRLTITPVR